MLFPSCPGTGTQNRINKAGPNIVATEKMKIDDDGC